MGILRNVHLFCVYGGVMKNVIIKTVYNLKSVPISKQWAMRKAKKLCKQRNPECSICGYTKHLEAHHIVPVHIDPDLACDQDNLITLCRSCHFTFGHFHNFRKYWNKHIVEHAQMISLMLGI